jgi:16S rRNA (adenine1518-N6/adenine1519-N6)-dimethyltransferase
VRAAGVRPARALGQHFLSDYNVVNRIVAAAELTPTDTVIEIGPGLGALTQRLAAAAGRVIAVELDERLGRRLREVLADEANVTIVHGDALTMTPGDLLVAAGLEDDAPYVVVGNLPYNAGTAIIRRFLEAKRTPQRLVVMLQREVAESITAAPGEMGLLGVSVQVYAQARRLFNVPARAFYPPPKVTSTVLRLDLRPEPLITVDERERFFRVVRAGFSAPRKQLRNTLANGLKLGLESVSAAIESAGLDPTLRPQQLSIENWRRLAQALAAGGDWA